MGGRFSFWKITLGGLIYCCFFPQHGLGISGTTGFLKKRHFSNNKIYFVLFFACGPSAWLKAWTSSPLRSLYFKMWKPRHSCPGLCASFSAIWGWCKWHVGWHERTPEQDEIRARDFQLPISCLSRDMVPIASGSKNGYIYWVFFGCCC